MNKPKKILLCGLKGCSNLGDEAILLSTQKIIERIISDNKWNKLFELKTVDFTFGTESGTVVSRSFLHHTNRQVYCKLKSLFSNSIIVQCKNLKFKLFASLRVNKQVTSDVAAIIFVGGGIIKYKYQKFYIYINEFTKKAEARKIPVLFSAVGVEGYDPNNPICKILQKSFSRNCVKVVSTRDDLSVLNTYYLKNNNICTRYKVSDPVCGISNLFNISIPQKGNTVGLGISRFNIFVDNEIPITNNEILNLWKMIIEYLEEKQIPWKVFTTGLQCDYQAELELKQLLGEQYSEDHFLPRPTNINELLKWISNFKATCVCRLHASIISYAFQVPTMAFVWNQKQVMFAEAINWKEYFITYPEILNINKIKIIIDKLLLDDTQITHSTEYIKSVYYPILEFFKNIIN